MFASVAGEVAVMAVDHRQAGAHVAREIEGGDTGTKREGCEGVPKIVDPPEGLDADGELSWSPLAGAKVVQVEVAAALTRKDSRDSPSARSRSRASIALVWSGTARRLASVFGSLSSRLVNERRT